jgi:transcriptional regulator with PAS, ATPase and Fis domain
MNPVALIAPYQGMAEMATEISKDFDKPIVIEVGDLQEGLKRGQVLLEQGVEVIISRGGTAQLLRRELPVPIVEIKVTVYDVLRALKSVKRKNKKIGIIGFGNVVYGLDQLGHLLDLDLDVFAIQKKEDVTTQLDLAKTKNVDIILGDKIVASHAARRGQYSILIESGGESILRSFYEAYEILEVVRSEAEKTRQYVNTLNQLKAVLDSDEDQIIILDSNDKIRFCNPAALQMLKKGEDQIQGLPLFLYPGEPLHKTKKSAAPIRHHLAHVQAKHLLLDYIPIITNTEIIGTLIVGRNISQVQKAERKIRKELYAKGHVARYTFSDLISEDLSFQTTIRRAGSFACSGSTVLIIGETGTGKEMFAQSMHQEKFGPERPFVAINCATLPEPLLESELFGYAPGAFTGARQKGKKGFFELAHGGTLLLDEIGELPINLQSRLLRVLEEREVQPIGDDRVLPVDVRLVASTNKDLATEVKGGRFRADLFYRLNVLQLRIPPLRERGRDAYVLFRHFVRQTNPKCGTENLWSKGVEKLLCAYQWPGNVRELRNLVERMASLTDDFKSLLQNVTEWLRDELRNSDQVHGEDLTSGTQQFNLREIEKSIVKELCGSTTLKQDELAKMLGVSRTTLWKIRKSA